MASRSLQRLRSRSPVSRPGSKASTTHTAEQPKHAVGPLAEGQPVGATNWALWATGSLRQDAVSGSGPALLLSGQGKPLESSTRSFFEPRVGYSLDRVRIHDDLKTNQAAAMLRARAFALGDRIGLGADAPAPTTAEGRFILGHELAHVGQAYAGRLHGMRGVSKSSDPAEVAASRDVATYSSPAWGQRRPRPAPLIETGDAIHRLEITINSGGRIIDTSPTAGDNGREDVLHLLDRLHTLWALTNARYRDQYRYVHALGAGAVVPMNDPSPPATLTSRGVSSPWSFQPTFDAITRNREPTIAAAVFGRYTGVGLTDGVGRGSANKREDVLAVILRLGMLRQFSVDFRVEHGAVSSLPAGSHVPDSAIPRTLEAITAFKVAIAEGSLRGSPRHADEAEFGGADRFGGRSIEVPGAARVSFRAGGRGPLQDFIKIFAVFVPRGVPATQNKVHLFFTPFRRPMSFVVQQGLRAQHENTEWILIGVPALHETDRPNVITIDTAEIQRCLLLAGRAANIDAIRMSAHSRGQRGLAHTIGVGAAAATIDLGLVEGISIFDASYIVPGETIRAHRGDLTRMQDPTDPRRFAPDAVRLYDVTVPNQTGLPGTGIDATLARGLSYVRMVQDGIAANIVGRGVANSLAAANRDAANRLLAAIPRRGLFSTRSPTPPRQVDLSTWLASHRADLMLVDHLQDGLKPIVAGFGLDDGMLRRYDAHHWFVTELAHEAIE